MKKVCEDCFFATIFVILCIIFLVCYIYVLIIGDTQVLFKNFDCFGNICGEMKNIYDTSSSVNMTENKFMIHTNFLHLEKSIPVCIKQCPNQTLHTVFELSKFIQNTTNICDCRVPLDMQHSQPRLGEVPLCPELPIAQSVPLRGICTPLEWNVSEMTHESRLGFKKLEKPRVLRLNQDVDFRFPWRATLICLVLTWGLSVLTLLTVAFFPTLSIPSIIVFANLGLIGINVSLFVRMHMLNTSPHLLKWGTNFMFASLQRYSIFAFGCLIAGFFVTLIVMNLIFFMFWQNDSRWKETQLLILRHLFQFLSNVLRELPSLIVILPILYLIGLYLMLLLSGLIILQMCTIVEPVRLKFTGCLGFRQHAWVQYGLIPAHILFSFWILRFYVALCQITNSIPVITWYNAAASNANIPCSFVLSTLGHKLQMQALGSVGFSSLLSMLNWIPLQFLTCLRTCIRQKPLNEQYELSWLKRLWKLESLLRQLDCNIYTMIAIEQKSFAKLWTHLNTGICEQSVPITLVELMRCCEILFTVAKLACSTTATLIAFAYFSNKPPVSQIYPFIILPSFMVSYLTASVVVGTLQHILSTILISFCIQEEQRFANEVFNDGVLIGFRHEEIKSRLAFIMDVKPKQSSWPKIPGMSFISRPEKNNDNQFGSDDQSQTFSELNVV